MAGCSRKGTSKKGRIKSFTPCRTKKGRFAKMTSTKKKSGGKKRKSPKSYCATKPRMHKGSCKCKTRAGGGRMKIVKKSRCKR